MEFPIDVKITPASSLKGSTRLSKNGMINIYNYEYTVRLHLGNPKQEMNLALNLNNDFTLIPLDTCDCHASNNWYSPSKSSSFKKSTETVVYPGSDYEFRGYWAKESFHVKADEVKKTDFIAITYDSGLEYFAADGFLGLGFGLAGDGHEGLIQNMKAKGIIKNAIFSIYINHYQNSYKQSVLTINSWKPEEYGNGVPSIIKVDKYSTGWETIVGGMWVGNTRIFSGSEYLIFDTLDSGLVVDSTAFALFGSALVKAVPSCVLHEYYYVCKCTFGNYANFPDISIGIGSQQFVIHAENYLDYLSGECEVMIYSNQGNGVWVAGLPYFREYYNMFDLEKKEIHVVIYDTSSTTQPTPRQSGKVPWDRLHPVTPLYTFHTPLNYIYEVRIMVEIALFGGVRGKSRDNIGESISTTTHSALVARTGWRFF